MRTLSMPLPSVPAYRKEYKRFSGVDFGSSVHDERRSPEACNLYAEGDMLIKRPGYRVLRKFYMSVNSLYTSYLGGSRFYFAQCNDGIYVWGGPLGITADAAQRITDSTAGTRLFFTAGTKQKINSGAQAARECVVALGSTGIEVFDGTTLENHGGYSYNRAVKIADCAYKPVTASGRLPDGSGGEVLESVNLLTRQRRNLFCGDGKSDTYVLDGEITTAAKVSARTLDGEELVIDEARGSTVRFATAPPASATGESNVEITFEADVYDMPNLGNCRNVTSYTLGNGDQRIILSGHPFYPNYEWVSQSNEALYFPEENYLLAGNVSTEIMGYADLDGIQCAVKQSSSTDPVIISRSYAVDGSDNAVITLKQGVSGLGALARGSFVTLGSEPLFLTDEGIVALTSVGRDEGKALRNRTAFINKRLLRHGRGELTDTHAVVYKGRAYFFVGNGVYVLDGTVPMSNGSYECFYWDGFPIVKAACADETGGILFSDGEGNLYKLSYDLTGEKRCTDWHGEGFTDPMPIRAVWKTVYDDDGEPARTKLFMRNGSSVTLCGEEPSEVTLYAETERGQTEPTELSTRGLTREGGGDITFPLELRLRRYGSVRISVENDRIGSNLRLRKLTRVYTVRQYNKNRRRV